MNSIHRALWLPGVEDMEQALCASNQQVLREVQDLILVDLNNPFRLVDLGCGTGGTLFFLLKKIPHPILAAGITISPIQAGLAQAQANKNANRLPIGFTVADFQAVPLPASVFDLVFSIEAFGHAPQPDCYLAEAARMLHPGGRLVIIDDFLSETIFPQTETHQRWLNAYRQGWRMAGLRTPAWVAAEAARHGFRHVREINLTAWLKLRIIPEWAANRLMQIGFRLPLRHAIWGSMLGSLALQHCLKAGLVEYHLLVFERQG